MNETRVTVVSVADDLERLSREINEAEWDDANDLCDYDADALAWYLAHEGTVFLACHAGEGPGRVLQGIASGRLLPKPYEKSLWLYVDEVDVCADQRKQGAGRAMMQAFLAIARESGCEEVWLGTEPDNVPARALYTSLGAVDEEHFVGYAWDTVST